jgi:hypothetical protein
VLIDNIFIITTDKKLAFKWKTRIEHVTKLFNIRLKKLRGEEEVVIDHLTPTNDVASEFSGVAFNWHGRFPRDLADKVPDLDALLHRSTQATAEPPVFSTTYRKLASILGQCLWSFRIQDLPIYRNFDYQIVSKLAFPSTSDGWDQSVSLTGEPLQALLRMYEKCSCTQPPTPHPPPLEKIETFAMMASDAAYSNGMATRGYCYSFMDSPMNEPKKVAGRPTHRPDSHIGIEELASVVDGVRDMKHHCLALGKPFPHLILLGIDSSHAKGMIVNSLARSPESIDLLRQLDNLLGSSRLFMVQVPSKLNPADSLTRPELDWNQKLWTDLVTRLLGLTDFATFNMEKYGKKLVILRSLELYIFESYCHFL